MSPNHRGNMLFIILLAVVLFAALAYAVTQSLRGSGKDASGESAQTYAAAIANYGALVANTVNRLVLTNDCKESLLSFENSVEAGYTNLNGSPAKCKVFDQAGGGLQWMNPETKWLDPYFTGSPWNSAYSYGKTLFPGNQSIGNVGTYANGYAASTVDLLLEIPYITDNVCKAINAQVGLPFPIYTTSPTTGATISMLDASRFVGRFSSCYPSECNYWASLRTQYSSSSPIITPPSSFCMTGTYGAGTPESGKLINMYVHVLLPR